MHIIDLTLDAKDLIRQIAEMTHLAFRVHWPHAYPDIDSALQDVHDSLESGRISRVALLEPGKAVGWAAAQAQYYDTGWELHPLVVHPDFQKQGIGRSLVMDLEAECRRQGAVTLFLGSDDEDNSTSLGGRDLYPDILQSIAQIKNLKGHPYEFYQKIGFVITGIIPDANGLGKPDIILSKRL
ncbi:MAG: GNAT family N-acetyltransferase [Candidatus Promineifilaceae bacterium]|nr:GNAT family N-acetyltransferase [Candidatus Promineifilaceae bacterium]